MNNEPADFSLSRLRWARRRGMLELDVLLGDFLNNGYETLDPEDKKRFILLLESTDPELIAWLMGHAMPEDNDLLIIINKIRSYVQSKSR